MKGRWEIPASRQGFTLLEVIVALSVLALMAVNFGAGMDVHASVAVEADVLRSHLGYAQSLAMANNVAAWRISFTADRYALERNAGAGWAAATNHWPGENSSVYVLPGGVALTPAGSVEINEWGAPAATHVVTLSDGTTSRQVSIVGFTGLVP